MAINRDGSSEFENLISVREAAKILRVSESTIWRWIDKGILPAYRIGPKRVCLRRDELSTSAAAAIVPQRQVRPGDDLAQYSMPMSPGPKESAEIVVARARALQGEMLARRGGVLFPESWIDINEMRDERAP